jgi:transcription-repair coupling factor (superfamily II helicase)
VDDLSREMEDRFGPVPPEAKALLDGAVLRLLGRALGVERVLLSGREGRVSFRQGVVPPLAHLSRPFEDRMVDVEVKRLDPLSLLLRQEGPEPLAKTLGEAFLVLSRAGKV